MLEQEEVAEYGQSSRLSDDELAELALAADPDQTPTADAVPISAYLGSTPTEHFGMSLPAWYMPAVVVRSNPRWRIGVIVAIVLTLLVIEAAGLCSTYGLVVPR
jgi:hypothetical protein